MTSPGVNILAGLVGIAILACVAHSAIIASGGYHAPSAPMIAALTAGLAVGAVAVGAAWRERRWLIAAALVIALVAGEAYALLLTAERTLAARDAHQAPLAAAATARAKAAARLEAARSARDALGSDTERLRRAIAAKTAADTAVMAKASERGCAVNCRQLLQDQVDIAAREIAAARAEMMSAREAAAAELEQARAALEALPALASANPLADRLGVEGWQIDLAAAGLASIAANGLGALLLAFAGHRRPRPTPTVSAPAVEIVAAPRDAAKEADRFARATFVPAPGGRVEVIELRDAYRAWCSDQGISPLPDSEIGAALSALFRQVGLRFEGTGAQAVIVGIERRKLLPAIAAAA